MKYCSNCGEVIEDDELTCPNCEHPIEREEAPAEEANVEAVVAETVSEPVSAPAVEEPVRTAYSYEPATFEAPPEKKRFSTSLKVAIAAIVGILVLGTAAVAIFSTGTFTSPVDSFRDIQRQSIIEPLASMSSASADAEPFSTDIILTAGMEGRGFEMAMIAAMLEQFSIEIGIDANPDAESILGLGFTALGDEIFYAAMTFTEDSMGLYIPGIWAHYTIDFESLLTLLGEDFLTVLENQLAWTGDEYGVLLRRWGEIILAAVNSNNLTSSRETVTLFDERESVTATLYTFTPNEADLRTMLAALVEDIRDDEVVFTLFAQQHAQMQMSLPASWHISAEEAWAEIFDEIDDAMLDEAASVLAQGNFTWRTAANGRQLLLQEIEVEFPFEVGRQRITFRWEGNTGRGGARTDWFTLEGFGLGFTGMVSFRNEMTVSGSAFDGTLRGYFQDRFGFPVRPSDAFMDVSYQIDRRNESILGIPYGRYEIDIMDRGTSIANFSLAVSAAQGGGSDHVLTIYGLDALGLGISSVFLNMHSTDAPSTVAWPATPAVDLSGLSLLELEWFFEDLLDDLEWHLEGLFTSLLMGLF
ncbi:MAG: zinc ribbon domain-containing protein [Oscillospiraceae bacterium]|nr:zinc ribbon domain-containing protein [Oscillospiraceae bacterium]